HRPLLVFELPAPRDEVAGREAEARGDPLLHVADNAAHVPALNEYADRGDALAALPGDVHAAAPDRHVRDFRERNSRTGRRIDQHVRDGLLVAALLLTETHDDVEPSPAFPSLRAGPSAERRFDD